MGISQVLSAFAQGRATRDELERALAGSVIVTFDGANRAVKPE